MIGIFSPLISLQTALAAPTVLGAPLTQKRADVTAPPYSHSWYVVNPDVSNSYAAMYNLGHSDGAFDSVNCTNSEVVLDFGQIGYDTPYYGGGSKTYGTYDFNSGIGYPFLGDSQITQALEQYALGRYDGSSTCPRLKLLGGTSNYDECLHALPCGTYNAGVAWANVLSTVNTWIVNYGFSFQVSVGGADDLETEWDTYNSSCACSTSVGFVNGWNAQTGLSLYDYGDADVPYNDWGDAQVYYVAWGATHDVPLPEVYGSGLVNQWNTLRGNHSDVVYYGVMTECASFTNPPPNGCSNPYNEYSPSVAYSNLYYASHIGSSGLLSYATNILTQ